MTLRSAPIAIMLFLLLGVGGCTGAPGYPRQGPSVPPDQITDFHTLYATNCQACHGVNGEDGPATDLANPEYQALVDDQTLRKIISNGMPGTQMPAWAQSAGGMLTDTQIDALIAGMRREWAKRSAMGAIPMPYAQSEAGDLPQGQKLYDERCSACHEKPARQQIASALYLSLVSDQALRTIIIAGRPDIGQPDWRHDEPGGTAPPLTDQDVTDIVTYLHSLRNQTVAAVVPNGPRR